MGSLLVFGICGVQTLMIEKQVPSLAEAIDGIRSGATILVGGFGDAGSPVELLEALLETDIIELSIVANNAGSGNRGLASLLREGRVRKIICSYPRSKGSVWFERRRSRPRRGT